MSACTGINYSEPGENPTASYFGGYIYDKSNHGRNKNILHN